jgi:hypothetical protein
MAQKQKVKIKNEIATVDGVDYVQWKRDFASNSASVYALGSGDELIFIRWLDYNTSAQNDPATRVSWVELKFLKQNISCEINSRGQKALVQFLLENDLIVNGQLNEEAAQLVVQKFGSNFSANRPDSVIIINN